MSVTIPLISQGQVLALEREFTPAELGLVDKNMKTPTTYEGSKVYVAGFKDFVVLIDVVSVGAATNGYCGLGIEVFDSTDTALYPGVFSFATLMNTKVSNKIWITFGRRMGHKVYVPTPGTPTPLIDDRIPFLKGAHWMKFRLSATQANNGTTSTANVSMRTFA